MKNTGLYFGSSTGHVEGIADKVAQLLGIDAADVHNVADATAESAQAYDLLILGSSTWGYGDLQDDWEGFLPKLAKLDLSGKQFAVFGCGDSSSYPDTFCDAMAEIAEQVTDAGATLVGQIPAEGYSYEATRCEVDGQLIGCCLDEDNESDETDDRLDTWVQAIKKA